MQSMTGFGTGKARTEAFEIAVEITGVNHKSRDIRVTLPSALQSLEPDLVRVVSHEISRGTLNVTVAFHPFAAEVKGRLCVDTDLLQDLCRQVNPLAEKFHGISIDAGKWLALPGVVKLIEPELDREVLLGCAVQALDNALDSFKAERIREGKELEKDLRTRHSILVSLKNKMAEKTTDAPEALARRFNERIEKLGLESGPDDERIAKEVALLVQKADVNEELVRLQAHLNEFDVLINETDEPVGRKLQFLCQEIHREINTLGSKTSEPEVSLLSLDFKTELDRLREQVLNIE